MIPDARTATEQRTVDVEVEGVQTEGRTLRGYAAVFDCLSEDMGGFRERIAPGAFADVLSDDVRLLVDHDGVPLARTKAGTLRLSEDARGLRFDADLPETTAARDLRESVSRGDVDGASFRFTVGEEQWDGDVRTIVKVAALRDVTVATYPAYPAASIELRSSKPEGGQRRQKGGAEMDPQENGANTAENTETTETNTETTATATEPAATEQRTAPAAAAGSLRVEQRTSAPTRRGLADEFRSAGWPAESAEVPWDTFESRTVTFSPNVNLLAQADRVGPAYPYDERWAWTTLPRETVDSGVTSVMTFTETAVTGSGDVLRDIDATTDKAEVSSTLDLVTEALKGVAAVQSNLPNVYLESDAINKVIERDLAMAINGGLDDLVVDSIAASGHQAPGSDQALVSYRKAISTLQASGYAPDTLILTPAAAEALDVLVSGVSGGSNDYVFGAGNFSTDRVFGLRKVVSKNIAAPVVLDSRSYATMYMSPVRLSVHEQDSGLTNLSRVRLECHAACAVARQSAAVRIAAS